MSNKMRVFLLLIFASIGLTMASNQHVSSQTTSSDASTGDEDCSNYFSATTRTTALNGSTFESTWTLTVMSGNEACPVEESTILSVCKGQCGSNRTIQTQVIMTCPLASVECIFTSNVYDCGVSGGDIVDVETCDGVSQYWERKQQCVDCDGNVVNETLCSDLVSEKALCPYARYSNWTTVENCSFTAPNCTPTTFMTRECWNETFAENATLCESDYLEKVETCSLDYDCCNCTDQLECPLCSSEYFVTATSAPNITEDMTSSPDTNTTDAASNATEGVTSSPDTNVTDAASNATEVVTSSPGVADAGSNDTEVVTSSPDTNDTEVVTSSSNTNATEVVTSSSNTNATEVVTSSPDTNATDAGSNATEEITSSPDTNATDSASDATEMVTSSPDNNVTDVEAEDSEEMASSNETEIIDSSELNTSESNSTSATDDTNDLSFPSQIVDSTLDSGSANETSLLSDTNSESSSGSGSGSGSGSDIQFEINTNNGNNVDSNNDLEFDLQEVTTKKPPLETDKQDGVSPLVIVLAGGVPTIFLGAFLVYAIHLKKVKAKAKVTPA